MLVVVFSSLFVKYAIFLTLPAYVSAYSGHTRKFSRDTNKKTIALNWPAHTPLSNRAVVVASCDFVKKESGETQQSRADNNTHNIIHSS